MDIGNNPVVDGFLSNLVEPFTTLSPVLWDSPSGYLRDGGIELVYSAATHPAYPYRHWLTARRSYYTYSGVDSVATHLTFRIQMSGSAPGFSIGLWNADLHSPDDQGMGFSIEGGTAYLYAKGATGDTAPTTPFTALDTWLNFEFRGPDEYSFTIQAGPGPTGPWTTLFEPALEVDFGRAWLQFGSFAYTSGTDSVVLLSQINTMYPDSVNATFVAVDSLGGFVKARQISAAAPDPAWQSLGASANAYSVARPPGTGQMPSGGDLEEYPALRGETMLDLGNLMSEHVDGSHYFTSGIHLSLQDAAEDWPEGSSTPNADFFAGIDYPWHQANRIEIVWRYSVSIIAYYRYEGFGGLTITAEPDTDYLNDASQVEFTMGELQPATIKAADSWDIDYPGIAYTNTDPPGLSIPSVRRYNGAVKTDVILTSPIFSSVDEPNPMRVVFPLDVKVGTPLPGMMVERTGGSDEVIFSSLSARATPVAVRLYYPEYVHSESEPLDTPLDLEPPDSPMPDDFRPDKTLPSTCGADNPPAAAVPCGAGSSTVLELVRQFSSQVRRAVRITGPRTIAMVDPNAPMPGDLEQDDADHMYTSITVSARAGEKTLRLGKGEVSMSASGTLKTDDVRIVTEGWHIPGRLPMLTVPPSAVKRVQYEFTPRGFSAAVDFHIPDDTIRARRPS